MYHPGPDRGPETPFERVTYVLFLVLLLGLFVAAVFVDYQPEKLTALFIVLFWGPLIALHEAGHALAAAALNWRVRMIVVGFGKPLARFRVGGAVAELRMLPVEGFVTTAPGDLRWPQVKSALIYFAGPGIELMLVGLLALAVGPDVLLTATTDYGLLAVQSLAAAAAAGAVLNLIPHGIRTAQGWIPNDGMGILQSLVTPTGHYAQMMGHDPADEEVGAWRPDDPDWWKK